jgi:hypothetical protein
MPAGRCSQERLLWRIGIATRIAKPLIDLEHVYYISYKGRAGVEISR